MSALRCARLFGQALLVLLAACSNGRGSLDGPEQPQPPPTQGAQDTFTVGGTVNGLAGSGLVLQNNGGGDLAVTADGGFAFANRLASNTTYNVSVKTQPSGQNCVVRNASGTIASANVTNVDVACGSNQFTVGGTVTGLAGSGLVLLLDGGDGLDIPSNGSFAFERALASGDSYNVTVGTQPSDPAQICTVANSGGTIGSTNVTSVRVTCASSTLSIGGTVNGLLGSGLVLQNNGGDDIEIESNGSFTFATALANGATYKVTVRRHPADPSQACTVSNGEGKVGSSAVTSVVVSCSTSDFTIGGTVRDMSGSGLVLRNNGRDELTIDDSGSFTFATALPTGATYDVTIAEQPMSPAQTCTVSNGFGVVAFSNVTSITVRCSTQGHTIGGRVRGLRGSGLLLQNNGSDDLPIASSGRFEFSTPLPRGTPYNVTVARQPSNPQQTCEVRDGSGTVDNFDVGDVEVRCESQDDDD